MKRDKRIDALRGLLMLLVIMGHIIQYILCKETYQTNLWFKLIYSFHMPLFMFISGYVAQGKLCGPWVLRRTIRLVIPFVVWTVIKCQGNFTQIVSCFYHVDKSIWFVWVLAMVTIFTYLAEMASKRIGVLAFVALNVLLVILPFRYFGFDFAMIHYTWFALGYVLPRYWKGFSSSMRQWIKVSCMIAYPLLFVLGLTTISMPGTMGKLIEIAYKVNKVYLVPATGIAFYWSCWSFVWKRLKVAAKPLIFIGKYTLPCYILQSFLHLYPFPASFLGAAAAFIVALGSSLVVGFVVSKNQWLNFVLFGGAIPSMKRQCQ